MKIAVTGPIAIDALHPYLNTKTTAPFHGSGGASISNLIIGLLELGQNVSAYALDPNIENEVILKGDNLTIYIGKYRRRGRDRMKDFFEFESRQIRDFIVKDKPDIVNAHWSYEFAIGAIRSGYPHLITFRDHAWTVVKYYKDHYRFLRFLMDRYVRVRGSNFSVNSFYLYNKIGIKKNCEIIPNPILEKFIRYNPKKILEQPIKIISILNGYSDRKNPKKALKAFHILCNSHPGIKFTYHIYGQGYEENGQAYQWAKDNNLLSGVELKGRIPHAELMEQITSYDLLFHPSKEESFGNIIIEAMANGLPVVGGEKSGAVPWLLKDGEYGILTDIEDENTIAGDIFSLINDKNKYFEYSEKGFDYVKNNFSSKNIAEKYLERYTRILSRP